MRESNPFHTAVMLWRGDNELAGGNAGTASLRAERPSCLSCYWMIELLGTGRKQPQACKPDVACGRRHHSGASTGQSVMPLNGH